ncbi:MAG: ATPase, T2SS/T4P/T4SS family [Clostridia bacterium]|nr:ATPase, T2SS/T4P/T4SS family [Clostridia bacterium]
MSVGSFNPLEYTDYSPQLQVKEDYINISDSDKIYNLTTIVKAYLRDNYGELYISSLVNPEHRREIRYIISDFIKENKKGDFNLSLEQVIAKVQEEITELGVIQKALDDPTITNIDINGIKCTYVEQNGIDLFRPEIAFQSEEHLYQIIDRLLLMEGKTLTAAEPHIDSFFRGFRVCAVLGKNRGGISTFGPLLSIRKFAPDVFTDEEVIAYGNISEEIRDFLATVVPGGANILITGGTNSGKTTTLIRLPLYLEPATRICTIEDSPEMMLQMKGAYREYKNIFSLEQKKFDGKKEREYDIAKNTVVALRLRPVWILIGEARTGEAAYQALQAMNTGHFVAMTIHANSARDGAVRFVQLAGNNQTVAAQVASSLDLIVFQKKMKNGKRVITEIVEITGYQGAEEPIFQPIFKYNFKQEKHERVGHISASLAEKLRMQFLAEEKINRWTKGVRS